MPRTFMNMSYGYDAVGNILSLGNSAAIPAGTALYGAALNILLDQFACFQIRQRATRKLAPSNSTKFAH